MTVPPLSKKRMVLVGIPNSGKSTLFNLLTGLRQRTGNYAGVTVEVARGFWKPAGHPPVEVVDLPGLYSLFVQGEDEKIVLDFLKNEFKEDEDLLCVVGEAARPFKSFFLLTQLMDMGYTPVLLLNMKDEWDGSFSLVEFIKDFLGLPVFLIQSGGKNPDISELNKLPQQKVAKHQILFRDISVFPDHESYRNFIFSLTSSPERDIIQKLSGDKHQRSKGVQYLSEKWKKASLSKPKNSPWDRILWNPWVGIPGFFISLLILFGFVYYVSELPMEWIDDFFQGLARKVHDQYSNSLPGRLVSGGIIPGLSGVMIFVPQIFILYAIILYLENSGVLIRLAFHLDKPLKKIGLNGQALIILMGASACAIPSILSLRALKSSAVKKKLIWLIPFISCSARIPVYIMFVYILILVCPDWKPFRALIFFLLYVSGPLVLILTSMIMNKISSFSSRYHTYITEVPPLRRPSMKMVLESSWVKSMEFVRGAGAIIFFLSVLIWYLSVTGPRSGFFPSAENTVAFSDSWLSLAGRKIHPFFRPLGYDEKTSIAILASLSAREVFIGTLSVMYNEYDERTLSEKISQATDERGKPVFTLPVCLSLLVFFVFALQCISTLSVTYFESGRKWLPVFIQFVMYNGFAYLMAFGIYRLSDNFIN